MFLSRRRVTSMYHSPGPQPCFVCSPSVAEVEKTIVKSFCNTHLTGNQFKKKLSSYFKVASFHIVLFSIILNNAVFFPFFAFPFIQSSFASSFSIA